MTQLSLFAAPVARARKRDPETSKAAARKADGFVASHEGKIFGAIHDAGARGATYKEIAAATRLEPVAVARRLGEMGERGLIERREVAPRKYESRGGCAVWWKA